MGYDIKHFFILTYLCNQDIIIPDEGMQMKGSKMKIPENTLVYMENMPRLNRVSGQINGIKKMIDEGRSCADILVQLRAVSSAIKAIESN